MKRNFITPVSMQVRQGQYEKDLRQPLLDMGYEEDSITGWIQFPIVVNNFAGELGDISNIAVHYKKSNNCHFIDHYNPELFLALAAMTAAEYGIVGEWWVCVKSPDHNWTEGKLYKANKPIDNFGCFINDNNVEDSIGYYHNNTLNHFRKATKEELINHFTKQEIVQEKEIDLSKGWIVKCESVREKNKVASYIKNVEWGFPDFRNYVINHFGLLNDNFKMNNVHDNIPSEVQHLPVLTYKQFEELILNKKEKEIIGYVLERKKYEVAARSICGLGVPGKFTLFANGCNFLSSSREATALKEAGVLDLWFKPVYKPTEKSFMLNSDGGEFEIIVRRDGLYYPTEGKLFSVDDIQSLITPTRSQINGYGVLTHINSVDIGCKKNIPVEDIKKCLDYYKDIKGRDKNEV